MRKPAPAHLERPAHRPPRARFRRSRGAPAHRELPFPSTWGGKRAGAGRPKSARSPTPHRSRPEHHARHPVHVTLRSAFRPLRGAHVFPTVRVALARANRREPTRFRVVHFSVQHDHLHLIVEANDKQALSSGIRSLTIRIARYVNDLIGRTGRFWADRWFGRALTSPRQVRNALVYVFANFRKRARQPLPPGIDPFSSGDRFDGFREWQPKESARVPWAGRGPPPLPRTDESERDQGWVARPAAQWLTRVGWRRHGLVSLGETPRDAPHLDGVRRLLSRS
jgi:putative transposase